MIVFDCETTGISPTKDRIVEISLYDTDKDIHYHYVLNPTVPIPLICSQLHHIYDSDVQHQPTFKDVCNEILEIIKDKIMVGYNSKAFDSVMLENEFKRCGIDYEIKEQIDLYLVWSINEKTKKLKDAYFRFCGKDLLNAHTSEADTLATYEIFQQQEKLWGIDNLLELTNQSPKRTDYTKLLFGKYKGRKVMEIADTDKQYLVWLKSLPNTNQNLLKEIDKYI